MGIVTMQLRAQLCRYFNVLHLTCWRGDRYPVFDHTFNMKSNGFADFRLDFAQGLTCGDAPG